MPQDAWRDNRMLFFKIAFGDQTGFVNIAAIPKGTRSLHEQYFEYPQQLEEMLDFIERMIEHNVYYCPQLLSSRRRTKKDVKMCTNVWADLDTCEPSKLLVQPNLVLQTSPNRYQALWSLEEPVEPKIGESLSRRIAYYHNPQGADNSGWDLTQLLRVPFTYNRKHTEPFVIVFDKAERGFFRETDFTVYPEDFRKEGMEIPMPQGEDLAHLTEAPEVFLRRAATLVGESVVHLFREPPTEDWSGQLWRFMMACYEADMDTKTVFWLARQAACNKYARDGRDEIHLWNDVCRAYMKHNSNVATIIVPETHEVELLSDDELRAVEGRRTFVERYIEWASGLGDAAKQYHQAGAFIVLSSLLAGRVVLPTSFGTVLPNLWFMILADTTLTRKSTAMDIAVDLLVEVDSDAIMTTDGSLEGLLNGLSQRPGRPSIFLRDEFTGLLESMTKKDYMAGMAETLTKLYDGKMQKRMLSKSVVEVKKPVLILFAGGIKAKTQQLLTLEHISSGFMPRFVFITAESDASRVQPMGPPVIRDLSGRQELLGEMVEMFQHYSQVPQPTRGIALNPESWQASMTKDAWRRFNQFEEALLKAGLASARPDILTPVYDRLGKSALKCAVLLAASESRSDSVVVNEIDIIHAIKYAQGWREYAIDIINGVGKSTLEHEIDKVLRLVTETPGVSRSDIMQRYHLTARAADALFQTMEQRNLIQGVKVGRATHYHTVGKGIPVQ